MKILTGGFFSKNAMSPKKINIDSVAISGFCVIMATGKKPGIFLKRMTIEPNIAARLQSSHHPGPETLFAALNWYRKTNSITRRNIPMVRIMVFISTSIF